MTEHGGLGSKAILDVLDQASTDVNDEQWLPVDGYEGIYEVSDQGRVRSLDRLNSLGRRIKGAIRKAFFDREGYAYLKLCKNGEEVRVGVARIVLSAFVGRPEAGQCAAHADFDGGNARLDNLWWADAKEVARRSHEAGKLLDSEGFSVHAKLTPDQIERAISSRGVVSCAKLGRLFGVSTSCVNHARNKKLKHMPGFKDEIANYE